MNDRVLSLLENYDLTVLRSRKGRGAIILETEQGLYQIREYTRRKEKLPILERLVTQVDEAGVCETDHYLATREGQWYVQDRNEAAYIVKQFREGRECDIHDRKELVYGARLLAGLHRVMKISDPLFTTGNATESGDPDTNNPLMEEFCRHNRELRKVLRYLKHKSQRTEFELFLLREYAPYMEQAECVAVMCEAENFTAMYREAAESGQYIHGEYQYHNILFADSRQTVINFENAMQETRVRDLYYYLRKAMEKNDWNEAVGIGILEEYEKINALEDQERRNLFLRLLYPDKFRKIVNCYFNGPKSLLSGKIEEKLRVLLEQQKARESFLNKHFFFG
ncbi:MAG: phosphotransferase [Lachnospiraceae bacterium]